MKTASVQLVELSRMAGECARRLAEAALDVADPQLRATLLQRAVIQRQLALDLLSASGVTNSEDLPTEHAGAESQKRSHPVSGKTRSSQRNADCAVRAAQIAMASGMLLRGFSGVPGMPEGLQYTLTRCYENARELERLLKSRMAVSR